jgi:hypothetical protein
LFIGKKSPAALFSDIGFVAGGKRRGFFRLDIRVATPGRAFSGSGVAFELQRCWARFFGQVIGGLRFVDSSHGRRYSTGGFFRL